MKLSSKISRSWFSDLKEFWLQQRDSFIQPKPLLKQFIYEFLKPLENDLCDGFTLPPTREDVHFLQHDLPDLVQEHATDDVLSQELTIQRGEEDEDEEALELSSDDDNESVSSDVEESIGKPQRKAQPRVSLNIPIQNQRGVMMMKKRLWSLATLNKSL